MYGDPGPVCFRTGENEEVSYGDGTVLNGVYLLVSDSTLDFLMHLDDVGVKLLGDHASYYGADAQLHNPPDYFLGEFSDDEVLTYDCWHRLQKPDLQSLGTICLNDYLCDIQTVTLPSGVYTDALILWTLDSDHPYAPLDPHGLDMGIEMPTAVSTQNQAVTQIEIRGMGLGTVAEGDFDAASGDLAWLRDWVPSPVAGDCDLDEDVDLSDLAMLASRWDAAPRQWWMDGDFNGDFDVNIEDLSLLASNWGAGTTAARVPDPASLLVMGLGGLGMLRRRR